MKGLLNIVRELQLPIARICEVGVNSPDCSQLAEFLAPECPLLIDRCIFIEPLLRHAHALQVKYAGDRRVQVYPMAISDKAGVTRMYDLDHSSFLVGSIGSPAMANEPGNVKAEAITHVACQPFDALDDGRIDLLACDMEGAEWLVIKAMRSRPRLICLEMHCTGASYVNPCAMQIKNWMKENNYEVLLVDDTDVLWAKV